MQQQQQQQQFFNNSSQHLPQTPDSAGILIATAASVANERRGQKNIMNCFRDRTPSYTCSNSQLTRATNIVAVAKKSSATAQQLNSQQRQQQQQKRPEDGVVILKEPRSRPRPIKLTLLKSSSTKDLSRIYDIDLYTKQQTPVTPLSAASSIDLNLNKMTSSSASSITNSSYCSSNCNKRIQKLEQKLEFLEKQLVSQEKEAKTMSTLMEDMQKKMVLLQRAQEEMQNKRKKSSSMRVIKKDSTVGQGQTQNTVQPSKLVAWMKLSNFWKQRPSIQTLKDQEIYKDEPCFDTEIELVLKDEIFKTVPKIVVDCCQLIEEKYRKSPEPIEGIYRQCGDYNKMQALRFSIDNNDYMALRQPNVDIHTLAGVLKLFLREIKSPLVSHNEAKTFIGKPNQWLLTDLPSKLDILKRLIRSLPEANRDTMEYLFNHFNKLTKVPLQHTSAETLAISVTPSIFHTVQTGARIVDMHQLLKETEILSDCVKIMIEYHQKIFDFILDSNTDTVSSLLLSHSIPKS